MLLQRLQGHGGGGIAGHHQHLDPALDQEGRGLQGITQHRGRALGAVGDPGGIPEIDEVLTGELTGELLEDRKPTDPGIEYADSAF